MPDWATWQTRCAHVLESNRPDSAVLAKLPYRYTCPAREKGYYLPQWLWDSCFHALVYRWFEPQMAWEELQSLLVHQVTEGDDAGMVPHMAHFAENDDSINQQLFQHPHRSMLTQPPLIAIAALAVHEKNPQPQLLEGMYPLLKQYHAWFDRRRDPDGDHLVTIIHPWESGWDATQRWDSLMGITDGSRAQLRQLGAKRKAMVAEILAHHSDIESLAAADYPFLVEAVDFNAIRAADLAALAEIAAMVGDTTDQARLTAQAQAIRHAIREKMIRRNADGTLHADDLVGVAEAKHSPDSAAKFVLLFGGCVEAAEAEALRAELFAADGPFTTPYPIPTTPINNPTFNGSEYWRGNVWLVLNWLVSVGLGRNGFHIEAQHLTERSLALVEQFGFCEFFDPLTGQRGSRLGTACPQNQSWSTIVLDMLGRQVQ